MASRCLPWPPVCGFPVASLSALSLWPPVASRGLPSVASLCPRFRLHCGGLPLPPVCGFPLSSLSAPSPLPPVASRLWLPSVLAFGSTAVASRRLPSLLLNFCRRCARFFFANLSKPLSNNRHRGGRAKRGPRGAFLYPHQVSFKEPAPRGPSEARPPRRLPSSFPSFPSKTRPPRRLPLSFSIILLSVWGRCRSNLTSIKK